MKTWKQPTCQQYGGLHSLLAAAGKGLGATTEQWYEVTKMQITWGFGFAYLRVSEIARGDVIHHSHTELESGLVTH